MTGDSVNDAPALMKADIGIAVDDATDAARSASDIVLTEPGLSVIISAVLTCRATFQAALTGESLPITRNSHDFVFSGSICKQGEIEAVVIATGVRTFLGKADHVLLLAARASRTENQDAIDAAIVTTLAGPEEEVPEKSKESPGGPWQFVGLLSLFDPPRHDSAETIRRALQLGVNVKMITDDQLAIAKETRRRLGMGVNMYTSAYLLGQHKDKSIATIPVEELTEKADGFAGVFPEHKYETVKKLQESKHIVGTTGDGVNDAPALKKADIGNIMTISEDRAKPSPSTDSWKFKEVFATSMVHEGYLALMRVVFFWLMHKTDSFRVKSRNKINGTTNIAKLLLCSVIFVTFLTPCCVGETIAGDVIAVKDMYELLNNPVQLNWSVVDGDPCLEAWTGIICEGSSIISIELADFGLSGQMGTKLHKLKRLKHLDMSFNEIEGSIPFGLPFNLTYLNLAGNQLKENFPSSFVSLSKLQYLNVSLNKLSGPLGTELCGLADIVDMDLSKNHFDGELTTCIANLSSLRSLNLEDNHFTGLIPEELKRIPNLKTGGNDFLKGPPISPLKPPPSPIAPHEFSKHTSEPRPWVIVLLIVCGLVFVGGVVTLIVIRRELYETFGMSRSQSSVELISIQGGLMKEVDDKRRWKN